MATEDYVKATAEAIGLPIPEEYFGGVLRNFERSEALAKQVLEFPLPQDLPPAPVYKL